MPLLLSHAPGFQRRKWRIISLYAGLVVSFTGGAVLAGWLLDLAWLKTLPFTGPTAMKANTALAFVATGLALLLAIRLKEPGARALRRFKLAEIAAAFPLLIGSLTVLQYVLGWDLGIDQLLFRDHTALINTVYPGRMGLNTAINFVLAGSALLILLRRSQASVAQVCALAISAIALQALVGYAYDVRKLYQVATATSSMAFPTALTFMVVAIALLCVEPDRGLMQPLTSPLIGGVVAQQLFLAIFIFPLLFGWIVLQGWRYGWYDAAFAISALVLLLITIASLFIWKTATILNCKDQQRHQAESQLQEALENLRDREARLSRLADANIIGILFGDIEGSVHRANDELLRIIGYRRQELEAGQIRWRDITPPEFLPLDQLRVAEAQAYGACTPYEKEYIRQDGQRIPVLVGYVLVGEERRDAIAFILDLSERKQLENSLRHRTEELERANRLKDEFLAILSHELRTPLNPILGWTQILKTRRLDAAKASQALETIERNVRLQITLIDDLLDVSRILRGKLYLQAEPVDLVAVVEAAIANIDLAAESKSISMQFLHEAMPIWVRGDRDRLQQVIWNLLSNSVKFTPPSGKITIHLSTTPTDATLAVSDTGQGISASFLPYVFDNFRQEDGSSTRHFGGLGLGLTISKHLVELHGGRICASSAGTSKGSTFSVELPLLPATEVGQRNSTEDPHPLTPSP